jgi:hypothetical protein
VGSKLLYVDTSFGDFEYVLIVLQPFLKNSNFATFAALFVSFITFLLPTSLLATLIAKFTHHSLLRQIAPRYSTSASHGT